MIHEVFVLSDACDRLVLEKYGLNTSQYRLLTLLHQENGQRMTSLSECLMVSKSTITRIVDQLEHFGWVRRIADSYDRRAQCVILTPDGSKQRAIISAAHMQSLDERMQCLEGLEQEHLEALLDKLCDGLRSKIEAENAKVAAT
jgi:DNA-binding MarR family transcriptional regulator